MRAFMFPGQGSQHIGMGAELAKNSPAAKAVFDEVDSVLDQNLSKLMFEGPIEELTLTENSQPALMAVSVAIIRTLESRGILLEDVASYVAGHSLGEYSALCATGALTLKDAADLLKKRGQAMQKAVPVGVGAMAALLGLDFETVAEVALEAAQDQICTPANDNAPGQVVISGHREAVERGIEIAKAKGAKRGILLPVSAPFHCSLMAPAADHMAIALDSVDIFEPKVPVISNVTAMPVSDPGEIKNLLISQVTGVVRWRESVINMASMGVLMGVECGAGKVLSGLARRIAPVMETLSLQTMEDIEHYLSHFH